MKISRHIEQNIELREFGFLSMRNIMDLKISIVTKDINFISKPLNKYTGPLSFTISLVNTKLIKENTN